MTEPFITFQRFNDQIEAMDLGAILEEANIEYVFENASAVFDVTFANSELSKEFRIKIKHSDFERADVLLEQICLAEIDIADKDYFLFEFTDAELIDVVSKKDEWGQFNFMLAQKILKDRGKEMRPEKIASFKKERIEELKKPEESQAGWINLAYVLALFGGLFGIFIGMHLATHKRTLPNGERVYGYSLEDRKHGNTIVIIGAVFFVIWMIIYFLREIVKGNI